MSTPSNYEYISQRLCRKIVLSHDRGRGVRVESELQAKVPGFGRVTVKRQRADDANPYDLAARATKLLERDEAVVDLGAIHRDTVPAEGQYVRARAWLQQHLISLPLIWERGPESAILTYAGLHRVAGIGRVFLGLIGSASNATPETSAPTAGRTPSHALGLYPLIDSVREAMEPKVSRWEHEREADFHRTDASWFQAAASLFTGSTLLAAPTPFDVLLVVHRCAPDVDLSATDVDGRPLPPVDLAIIGSPVWVAEPPAVPFGELAAIVDEGAGPIEYVFGAPLPVELVTNRADPVSSRTVADIPDVVIDTSGMTPIEVRPAALNRDEMSRFETILQRLLEAETAAKPINVGPWPDVGRWDDLVQWFLECAARHGPPLLPLAWPKRVGIWRRLSRNTTRDALVDSGRRGWFVPLGEPDRRLLRQRSERAGLMMCLDGTVWDARPDGSWAGEGRATPIEVAGERHPELVEAMFRAVGNWRRPFFSPDEFRVEVADGFARRVRP